MEQHSIREERPFALIRPLSRRVWAGAGKSSPATTQAVCRAVRLLECLATGGKEGLGITELSHELTLPKSTIHRLLQTLAHEGYVEREPRTERYALTPKVLKLGAAIQRRMRLPYQARAHLLQLMQSVDEVVTLATLVGEELLVVDRVGRPERMNPGSDIGMTLPLPTSAAGKAILAALSSAEAERLLSGRLTPELVGELEGFRYLGYALDEGEYRPGVKGVAAAIRDREGKPIAAVEVDIPIVRLTTERLEALSRGVQETAESISIGLGFHGEVGF